MASSETPKLIASHSDNVVNSAEISQDELKNCVGESIFSDAALHFGGLLSKKWNLCQLSWFLIQKGFAFAWNIYKLMWVSVILLFTLYVVVLN
nr:hypothetical protein Iba_scaffold535274CG0010 [Ipomoea batatas]